MKQTLFQGEMCRLNKKYAARKGIAVFSDYLLLCKHAAACCASFDKSRISARPTAFYSKPGIWIWIARVCGRKTMMTHERYGRSHLRAPNAFKIRVNTFSSCANTSSLCDKSVREVVCEFRVGHATICFTPDVKFVCFCPLAPR